MKFEWKSAALEEERRLELIGRSDGVTCRPRLTPSSFGLLKAAGALAGANRARVDYSNGNNE